MAVQFDPAKHCGATNRAGAPCTRPLGWGTSHPGVGHCKYHLGSTPTHERAAQVEIARRECEALGVPIVVDPGEALLSSLFEREGNVAFYRSLVQELEPEEGGIYVAIESSDGDGGTFRSGEAKPHVLVELYHREMHARDQVAVALLKAGVEERRVRLAEGQAQQIASFARGLLSELGIDPSSPQARAAFRKHLELVAGSD